MTYTITRTLDKGVIAQHIAAYRMDQEVYYTFKYAVEAYSHLIEFNEVLQPREWILKIVKAYGINKRVKAVCDAIHIAMEVGSYEYDALTIDGSEVIAEMSGICLHRNIISGSPGAKPDYCGDCGVEF